MSDSGKINECCGFSFGHSRNCPKQETNKVLRNAGAVSDAVSFYQDIITARTNNLREIETEMAELTRKAEYERAKIDEMIKVKTQLQGFEIERVG